jgi:hypothetical protein
MKFDLSLLAPYARHILRAEPHANPFVAHFSKGRTNYVFVAADHSPGPASPTFEAVDFAFARHRPQIVIVEGVQTEEGYSPEEKKALAAAMVANQFSGRVEPFYVIHRAMQRGIPFVGGEPTEASIYKGLLDSGMAATEIQAFFLGYFGDPKQAGVTDWNGHARWLEDQVARSGLFRHIPVQDRIGADAFRAWYEQHQGEVHGRPPWMLTRQDYAPFDEAGSTHFNRLSAQLTAIRCATAPVTDPARPRAAP